MTFRERKIEDPVAYTPTSIQREGERGIRIEWNDGEVSTWTARELRDTCPCATCREKRGETGGHQAFTVTDANAPAKPMGLPVLSAAEARPLTIDGMQPVGTYAYNIRFSDGHSSGLFTLERLRRPAD
ncbi:DUF971 domain-containing protein [Rhodopirellula halodulae]|uniref:DUF971 domain-containing protein n=1 Tax=Rhodopirellula halodulae TaxID=2894198 RepID=UPI001E4939F2|nr:DUF971 domain-containing protein [Rhodopirellula sp. JC737]MCC9656028.1 DUF971 domain-containing protein [Rhodopirellula sp. JC737]